MNKGKYPLNFWINMDLKERSDKIRAAFKVSHAKLYEEAITKREEQKP
jgi:hypothetical protein